MKKVHCSKMVTFIAMSNLFFMPYFVFTIDAYGMNFTDILCKPTRDKPTKYIIFDTDMGADDA